MTDQEQIEEMAVDIAKRDCSLWEHCPKEPKYNCISQNPEIMLESSKNYVTIANWLVNAGYRKADEVRRETAKKIFDALYQWLDLENTEKCGFATIQKFDLLKKFREIYQQLGTEIKE